MVISGRRLGGDARTHNLPLTGIYKGIFAHVLDWRMHAFIQIYLYLKTFVHTQNLAFVSMYTFI